MTPSDGRVATPAARPVAPAASAVVAPAWLATRLYDTDIAVFDATARLAAPVADGDYRVSTGRPRWEAERIPGSRYVDLLAALSDPDRPYHFGYPGDAELARRLPGLGIHAGTCVVSYDRDGGIWAARLWWMLRGIGIDARVLDGGWASWTEAACPVETGQLVEPDGSGEVGQPAATGVPAGWDDPAVSKPVAARPGPGPGPGAGPGAWASRRDVEEIVAGRRDAALVCALGYTAFEGTVPTRYTRRGHIPGSLNLPARGTVDKHGRLLPGDELRDLLAPLLDDPRPLVLYCGGGISACLLALALTEAGRADISVYDGSLEEWTADPRLPVSVGRPAHNGRTGP